MPPRLDEKSPTVRSVFTTPESLIHRVNEWRKKQPENLTYSEAIRLLVEKALERDDVQ